MMAAAAGMQAVGAITQGREQAQAMNYSAQLQEQQAAATRGAAEVQANQMREAGRRQLGQARSALAGSGVRVDAPGSALEVQSEISRRAEQDALSAILSGRYQAQSMETEAAGLRSGARNVRRAGLTAAATSVLAAGARYSQWQSSLPKPAAPGWVSQG